MAQKKKRGILDKFMLGSEKSEGFARASLPSNRWELFWDIFKGSFFKIIGINLLIIIFCIPLAIMLFFKTLVESGYGMLYPFSQGFGVGYGSLPELSGLAESVVFQSNAISYLLMPLMLVIAGIGIAGGAYVIRNLIWTEGVFVTNDFWHGIKKNFKQIAVVLLVYGVVFYVSTLAISLSDMQIATSQGGTWLFVVSKVVFIVVLFTLTIMTLHMITMAVTYETTILGLFKNSLYFTIGLLPQNIFFIVLGLIPYLISLIGGLIGFIGGAIIFVFGIAYFLLVWTNFCQWSYDKFVNDKIGAKKYKGIYKKIKQSDSQALKQYNQQVAIAELSAINRRPVKPITDDELTIAELPTSFNRADIERLNQSKQAIYEDHERYVEMHTPKTDAQKTLKQAEIEKVKSERDKRIEKAKQELAKRNKNN